VTGTVFSAETGLPPSPGATVKIGSQQATTGTDGKFTLTSVPSTSTTATITANPATGSQAEQPLSLILSLKSGAVNDLGSIYLSNEGYTATATGRVVTSASGVVTPVGGAMVTIGGDSTTTGTDGRFTLNNLPVGLGSTAGFFGKITASGFDDKLITADVLQFPLVTGGNPLGDIPIAPPIGTAPLPPNTVNGVITVHGNRAAGATVVISLGSAALGTVSTGADGSYSFWLAPATYTLTATYTTASQTVSVTVVRPDVPVTVPTIDLKP
jgi:hypothetical protein